MRLACLVFITACTTSSPGSPPTDSPTATTSDAICSGAPAAVAMGFDHDTSKVVASLGESHHRGVDLIATADADPQIIKGAIAYSASDKALEDEAVEVFACNGGGWQRVGTTRTNSEGRFELSLAGSARLPLGMRDLYVSVVGDRTGAAFLGLVAPAGTSVFVSDVDGTLTSSENEFPESLVTGDVVAAQPHAAAAFAAATNLVPIYLTARGDQYTDTTRAWLAGNGFPRGPMHLADSLVTIPGEDTVEFKTSAMQALAGFSLEAGIGNRASDITAYTNVGVAPDRIFIKLPEFSSEVGGPIASHEAIGLTDYANLVLQ